MRRGLRRVFIFGALLLALSLCIYFFRRPITRFVLLPSATSSAWVEEIALPPSFSIQDFTVAQLRARSGDQLAEQLKATYAQKRKFFMTYRGGQGKYGVHQRLSSAEGDLIHEWWLVEDGRVTFVTDASRDEFGQWPGIKVTHPGVKLGALRDGKFVEMDPGESEDEIVVLRFDHHAQGDIK